MCILHSLLGRSYLKYIRELHFPMSVIPPLTKKRTIKYSQHKIYENDKN